MNNFSGYARAALQIGATALLGRPTRGIFNIVLPDGSTLPDIIPQVVEEERHQDNLELTQHPIDQGAAVSDHAYKIPPSVILRLGWSDSPSAPGGIVSASLIAATTIAAANERFRNVADVGAGAVGIVEGVNSILNGNAVSQARAAYMRLVNLMNSRALFSVATGKRDYLNMLCTSLSASTDFKTEHSLEVIMTCQQVIRVQTQVISLEAAKQQNPSATASPVAQGTVSAKQVPIEGSGLQ